MTLEIKNLHVEVELDEGNKEIIKGLDLVLEKGKVHALMGPNGSGKSTLANAIMGHPKYKITKGKILLDGESILELTPNERAKKGLFLSFQYPQEIEGINLSNFLRESYNSLKEKKISLLKFNDLLKENVKKLNLSEDFLTRYLNKGFSGGEKKKSEILQLLTLNPRIAILDETDSGLDIDSLKIVSEGINDFKNEDKIVLVITHYKRILNHIKPDKVHIMIDGKIAQEGDLKLVDKLEEEGYSWINIK